MSYASEFLGHCDEPSPNTEPDATMGVWCTLPAGHEGRHLFYGIDCWTESEQQPQAARP